VSGKKTTRAGDDNPRPWRPPPDAPDGKQTRVGDTNPSTFGWTSPRWREPGEPDQGDVEKDRRHGAIERC
jgi:hypothetical protein